MTLKLGYGKSHTEISSVLMQEHITQIVQFSYLKNSWCDSVQKGCVQIYKYLHFQFLKKVSKIVPKNQSFLDPILLSMKAFALPHIFQSCWAWLSNGNHQKA